MPPFDREGALKRAEKALRQGRVDAAIEEYLRLLEVQPRDWNSANALGDLYVKAGQVDRGLAQYTQIAEHLAADGFISRAAALYKKTLKIKPDDERAQIQLADLSARQGLIADAKATLQAVAERRRLRGDVKGAAEIDIRIGTLDPDDLEARLGAARAAGDQGDLATALRELLSLARAFEDKGRTDESTAALEEVVRLDPTQLAAREQLLSRYIEQQAFDRAEAFANDVGELKRLVLALDQAGQADRVLDVLERIVVLRVNDTETRARLASAYARRGDLERAARHVSPATAGSNPTLWMLLAELALRDGRVEEGCGAIARAIEIDPGQREAAVSLASKLAESAPEAAYPAVEVVADGAVLEGDFAAAAAALHEFVSRVRQHMVALMRLVEVCVDGGLEATLTAAQAQLADAYLESGRPVEARVISEDLVAREPWDRANIERFRTALIMLGEKDPDAVIADRLSGESPFTAVDKIDLNEGVDISAPLTPAASLEEAATRAERARASRVPITRPAVAETEIDLSDALDSPADALGRGHVVAGVEALRRAEHSGASVAPVTDAFAQEQYRLALRYRQDGMDDEALEALEVASRSPRQRFEAAYLRGQILVGRRQQSQALTWLEMAANTSAPTADLGRSVRYDLATTLEHLGHDDRAMAVFAELEAELPGYRDVSARLERLTRLKAQR